MKSYDLLVLGAGSAGFNAARTAVGLGKSVALVDGARKLGGLCILAGCMPSKTLLWPAEVLHQARKAERYGLRIPIAEVNMAALQKRKQKIIAEFADFRRQQMESGKYEVYRQKGRFVDPHCVALADGTQLRAERVLISTGSRVAVPPVEGLAGSGYWTSEEVLNLKEVPPSVLVLGGGVVACELAQLLRRLGSRVTQIQRSPRLLKEFSPEASSVIQEAFTEEGIEVHTGTKLEKVTHRKSDFEVTFTETASGKKKVRRATALLNALGREPNTEGLDLEKAGVATDAQGRIRVNQWQQSTQAHIYAGGDVCGPYEVVHLAVQQGELAARHAFGVKGLKTIDYSQVLSVVFTSPALASLGPTETELKEKGLPYLKAAYPFNDHGKSILMDENHGFVSVLAEPKKGRLLGAEIVGPEAGELIHCLSVARSLGATAKDLLKAPWYHPTLAEILTYPLEEIAEQVEG